MKTLLLAALLAFGIACAQTSDGLVVSVVRNPGAGVIITFTTDNPAVQGYAVEIHYTLRDGSTATLRTYCMSRYGGGGGMVLDIGNYATIFVSTSEIQTFGRGARTSN